MPLQRLRFEHPPVKVVVLRSGKNRVFCPAPTSACSLARPMRIRSISANSPTNRNGLEDSTAARVVGKDYVIRSERQSTAAAALPLIT